MADGPTISTHILDTEGGLPAVGVSVELYRVDDEGETLLSARSTDGDGRIRRLVDELDIGTYRLRFRIDGRFFRDASVTFVVEDNARSYHVPLLMAPFGLSTYRGS